jgi:hypothetical protein
MEAQNIFSLGLITENLQYITVANGVFATADNSVAVATIGDGWSEGDTVVISGSNQTGNNREWTYGTVATGKVILVGGTVTADVAANTTVCKQTAYTPWRDISTFAKLCTAATTTGDCTIYVQQSQDGSTVDASTTVAVTGGTPASSEVAVLCRYGRLRVINATADQTSVRIVFNGRTVS